MNIIHPYLQFDELSERPTTDMIVIHHTGERDIDASAEQIHEWHRNQGWAGIGYHYVIRKNGDVEIGRPEWAIGSHAYGENSHTIGIHLSGDFKTAYPSPAQIDSCVELVADICRDYAIEINRDNIVGHCDLMATDCPGKNLYSQLDTIIARAKNCSGIVTGTPVETIFDLAARYESENNPAEVGEGYGLFQFTGATIKQFIGWLKNYPDKAFANYGKFLDENSLSSAWYQIGNVDPGHFGELQREFAEAFFFNPAVLALAKENYHVVKHSIALEAVVFSRAIQHGVKGCVDLFNRICPYPNLSYVDDAKFDGQIISAVYDYLIMTRSDLQRRWYHEKADALASISFA